MQQKRGYMGAMHAHTKKFLKLMNEPCMYVVQSPALMKPNLKFILSKKETTMFCFILETPLPDKDIHGKGPM